MKAMTTALAVLAVLAAAQAARADSGRNAADEDKIDWRVFKEKTFDYRAFLAKRDGDAWRYGEEVVAHYFRTHVWDTIRRIDLDSFRKIANTETAWGDHVVFPSVLVADGGPKTILGVTAATCDSDSPVENDSEAKVGVLLYGGADPRLETGFPKIGGKARTAIDIARATAQRYSAWLTDDRNRMCIASSKVPGVLGMFCRRSPRGGSVCFGGPEGERFSTCQSGLEKDRAFAAAAERRCQAVQRMLEARASELAGHGRPDWSQFYDVRVLTNIPNPNAVATRDGEAKAYNRELIKAYTDPVCDNLSNTQSTQKNAEILSASPAQ